MDFKEKSDFVLGMTENIKEWVINQPKKRCDMIEGHDNYWEGKIEEIKKVIDDTPQYALQKDFEKALNEIKKILDEA